MNFLSGLGDDNPLRAIPPAPKAQIRPAPVAQIRPAPEARIRPAPEARIRPAPQAKIRQPKGVFYASSGVGLFTDSMYETNEETGAMTPRARPPVNAPASNARFLPSPTRVLRMLHGLGEDGLPITRTITPEPIGAPSATTMAFPVPGAGMQAKSLGPQPIPPGPSGRIPSMSEEQRLIDPQEAFIQRVRDNIQPLMDTLASLKPSERQQALREAMDLLEFPGAADAVEKHALEYVAQGTPAEVAFREALSRVMAVNIAIATRKVLDAQAQRAAPSGLYGVEAVYGLGAYQAEGLGGFFSSVVGAVKKVVKTVSKVTKAVTCGIGGEISGAVVGAVVGKQAGGLVKKAGCLASQIQEKAQNMLLDAIPTGGKKKKKKAAPAPAPRMIQGPAPVINVSSPPPVIQEAPPPAEAPPPPEGMSTTTKIAIAGGAVVVLGGIAYVMTRKK